MFRTRPPLCIRRLREFVSTIFPSKIHLAAFDCVAVRYPIGNCLSVDRTAASKTFPKASNGADTTKGKSKCRRGVFTIERAPLSSRGVLRFSFSLLLLTAMASSRIFYSPFLLTISFPRWIKDASRDPSSLGWPRTREFTHAVKHFMLTYTYTHTHTCTYIQVNFRTLFFFARKIYREESCRDKGVNDFRISQLFERVSCEPASRA